MRSTALLREKKQVDDLFNDITTFANNPASDPYIVSLLTFHLCIRISGFVENCIRIIFLEYAAIRTLDHVQKFVNKRLERFPNPNISEIAKLTKDFNEIWWTNFNASITNKHRDSLHSINVNRNAIAHGGISNITLRELSDYYNDIVELIEKLEDNCI